MVGAERAATALLDAIGVDMSSESRRATPRRVAALFADLLSPIPFDTTTFPNDENYDELVVARSIPFHSLCEHPAAVHRRSPRGLPPRGADRWAVEARPCR